MPRKANLLPGTVFGRLTVVQKGEIKYMPSGSKVTWLCKCECGNTVQIATSNLNKGLTQSCGCYQRQRASESSKTHGLTGTREYRAWQAMWTRCTNPNTKDWPNYGGRGVTVCEDWKHFENFLQDMGECPEGYSLDRRDNNGSYNVANCRWASNDIQKTNKSNSNLVQIEGETVTITEACRILGLSHAAIRKHADRNGVTDQEATNYYLYRRKP